MNAAQDNLLFFVTAGRGTECFAAEEIKELLTPSHISVREGKVFFTLPSGSGLDMKRVLALRSVERVFVTVTDYDNSMYIETKKKFLDKLMSVLSCRENFLSAKLVLKQTTLWMKKDSTSRNQSISFLVQDSNTDSDKMAPDDPCVTHLKHPLRNNCFGAQTTEPSVSLPELEPVCVQEPKAKMRKLDVSCVVSETVGSFSTRPVCGQQVENDIKSLESNYVADSVVVNNSTVDGNVLEDSFVDAVVDSVAICEQSPDSQPESTAERVSENNGVESLSFRMSIKCSGKVSRWINIKIFAALVTFCDKTASASSPYFAPDIHVETVGHVIGETTLRSFLEMLGGELVELLVGDVILGNQMLRFPLSKRAYLMKSGLRAPVAWIISHLASVKPGDIVVDPMCGKSTILIEAAFNPQAAWFVGSDISPGQIEVAMQNLNLCGQRERISLIQADGLNMPYRDGSVDAVVCDAPFNQKHFTVLKPQTFYHKLIREIYRVLRPGGHCVLLTSQMMAHMIVSATRRTDDREISRQNIQIEMSCSQTEFVHDKTRDESQEIMDMTLSSSHYVKLGDTHAFIMVLCKQT